MNLSEENRFQGKDSAGRDSAEHETPFLNGCSKLMDSDHNDG